MHEPSFAYGRSRRRLGATRRGGRAATPPSNAAHLQNHNCFCSARARTRPPPPIPPSPGTPRSQRLCYAPCAAKKDLKICIAAASSTRPPRHSGGSGPPPRTARSAARPATVEPRSSHSSSGSSGADAASASRTASTAAHDAPGAPVGSSGHPSSAPPAPWREASSAATAAKYALRAGAPASRGGARTQPSPSTRGGAPPRGDEIAKPTLSDPTSSARRRAEGRRKLAGTARVTLPLSREGAVQLENS